MRHIRVDGCYPHECIWLLELVPEQVLDMVREADWLRDEGTPVPEEDVTIKDITGNGWINKGWRLWSTSHRTALYKHDGRFHLIQFYGQASLEEKGATP